MTGSTDLGKQSAPLPRAARCGRLVHLRCDPPRLQPQPELFLNRSYQRRLAAVSIRGRSKREIVRSIEAGLVNYNPPQSIPK